MTVDLYINAVIGLLPAAGKAAYVFDATLFVQNPTALSPLPSQTPDATATTDGAGNAEFTGLTSGHNYWIVVADIDGYHWTYCGSARLGNTTSTRFGVSYRLIYTSLVDQAIGSWAIWTDAG